MEPRVDVVDGEPVALVHDCNALCGDGVARMLPERSISLDRRWTVTGPDDAATLDPSIQCLACGLHGHWREGKWVP
jgi:hypothetical protein